MHTKRRACVENRTSHLYTRGLYLPLAVSIAFLLMMFAWGCGHRGGGPHPQSQGQKRLSVTDDLGRQISLSHPPQRIVSLAPNATEILYALGLGDRIIAVADFSDYPPEAKKKPSVGRYDRPSLEKIISYKPDLVIVGYGSPKELAPAITKTGVTSFAVNSQSIADILAAIDNIGTLCGASNKASKLQANLKKRLAAVETKVKSQTYHRRRVFIMVDQEPLWTAGVKTLQDEIIQLAGGKNIATRPSFYPISRETLFAEQPEVILLPAPVKDTKKLLIQVSSRSDLSGLDAIRKHRIITIDTDIFSRPGPRVVDAVEELAKQLAVSTSD